MISFSRYEEGRKVRKPGRAYFIVPGVLVVVISLIGGYFLMNKNEKEEEGDASAQVLCDGLVSRVNIDKLFPGYSGELSSKKSNIERINVGDSDSSEYSKCVIERADEKRHSVTLATFPMLPYEDEMWPYSARGKSDYVIEKYKNLSPIGGSINGSLGSSSASVWLPDSCNGHFEAGDNPVVATIYSSGTESRDVSSSVKRQDVRDALLSFVSTLTQRIQCEDLEDAAEGSDVPKVSERKAKNNFLCGIPGFELPRASSLRMREHVTDADFRGWSCVISVPGSSKGHTAVVGFTASQDPRIIKDYVANKGMATGETSLEKCDGVDTLIGAVFPVRKSGVDYDELPEIFQSRESLFQAFSNAFRHELSC